MMPARKFTVLVTGASGFVGSALCEEMVRRGVGVIAADRSSPPFRHADWAKSVTFVELDICDREAIVAILRHYGVTHIVHAAAITPDLDRECHDADSVIDVNVKGASQLMMAARETRPVRIVQLSSISVYGPAIVNAEGRFEETTSIPQPETLYGICKHAAEGVMRRLADLHDLDLCIIRLGPVFGPWEHTTGARAMLSPHHQITIQARAGQTCLMPRAVPADWLYSRDAAARIVDVLLTDRLSSSLVNLGGGAITTLTQWCEALAGQIRCFSFGIDAEEPTVRYGYPKDRPALDNSLIDTVSANRQTSLNVAARELLEWLDRFYPVQPSGEPE
jgi:UDP-glucose 4-epimerase